MESEDVVMKEALGGDGYKSACNIFYMSKHIADQISNYKKPLYTAEHANSFEINPEDSDSQAIDLVSVLVIFINGILQEPNIAYEFNGGSLVRFLLICFNDSLVSSRLQKSSSINFPNMFGRGEKLSFEYTYGTRNHTDSRINFSSPLDLDPEKQ